ncbi:MAG: Asp-tRNA(Asn)/Glu-tRNA(Gln) amidotransferase subunit GatB [Armatimonadota bacterium]
MRYKPIIGLEIHAQLDTESKMFCSCPNDFGAEPNTHVCPVCLGLPGVLPVANKRAIEFVIKTALALHCQVHRHCRFARKNYYYPDMPKNYQISQYEEPLSTDGWIEIDVNGTTKRVGIIRVHLEEDTGKSFHQPDGSSLEDYNRAGVPLMEVVSKPDMNSAEEARAYCQALQSVLRYIGVSNASPELGAMRCESSVNVVDTETGRKTAITELKNLNSFRAVHDSVQYEIARHIEALERGDTLRRQTRRWNAEKGITTVMRFKETADEYRYFPDPDLVPMAIGEDWIERIKSQLPELPKERRDRFVREYGIPEYDAGVLTATREMADFYEECVRAGADPKKASNWLMGDFSALLHEAGIGPCESKVSPGGLADMLALIEDGTISGKIAKDVFAKMFATGKPPRQIVEEDGLVQITDGAAIEAVVQEVIDENPRVVEQIRGGKEKAIGSLIGKVMHKTLGKANPRMVNEIMRAKLLGR